MTSYSYLTNIIYVLFCYASLVFVLSRVFDVIWYGLETVLGLVKSTRLNLLYEISEIIFMFIVAVLSFQQIKSIIKIYNGLYNE